jgi:hypothetical protein
MAAPRWWPIKIMKLSETAHLHPWRQQTRRSQSCESLDAWGPVLWTSRGLSEAASGRLLIVMSWLRVAHVSDHWVVPGHCGSRLLPHCKFHTHYLYMMCGYALSRVLSKIDSAMLATQQGCASWGGSGGTAAGVNGVHATALGRSCV